MVGVADAYESAAFQNQVDTDRPLTVENVLDVCGFELGSNFWMAYPGFMGATDSPLLQSNPEAAWPRVGARFTLEPAAISRTKSIIAFWTIQEPPSVLFIEQCENGEAVER